MLTISSNLFDTQVPSISTEELVLSRHARYFLSRLRCNGHSLLLNSYLSKTVVLNLYSLIYPLANFKSKIYPQIFSLLQIPIVVSKNLNFCSQNLPPRQVQGANLPPVKNPCSRISRIENPSCSVCGHPSQDLF